MLTDGLSRERREEFLKAEKTKRKTIRTLEDYIAFLMAVQEIKPFEHKKVITLADKNIL